MPRRCSASSRRAPPWPSREPSRRNRRAPRNRPRWRARSPPRRQAEERLPRIEALPRQHPAIVEIEERVEILHALLGEQIAFLDEAPRARSAASAARSGTRCSPACPGRAVGSTSSIGKKMQSSGVRPCFVNSRLWTCASATFDGKHGSMAPAAGARAIHLGARLV